MPADIRDILNEVYLRTQRTRPSGFRDAQRSLQYFSEVFGVEDNAIVVDLSIPITDSLVSWWSLDTASISGAQADDWWGSNGTYYNNGTITGATLEDGQLRDSLEFVANTHRVVVTDHSSIQDLFTSGASIEMWFYPKTLAFPPSERYLVAKGASWQLLIQPATPAHLTLYWLFTTTTGRWDIVNFFSSNPLDRWYHLVVTYNNSSTSNDPLMYINGTAVTVTRTTAPVGTAVSDVGLDLSLGNRSISAPNYLGGRVDEIRLYSKVLSASEVLHNYKLRSLPLLGTFFPGEVVAL